MSFNAQDMVQIYYYLALFSTILFVLKLIIFNVIGGETEVFADFTTEIDTDPSFNFLSVQSILAFFMGFSWMGYAGLKQFGFTPINNFIYAVIVGLIFMVVSAYLMFCVKKLEKNVKKDKKTAVQQVGKAYTNFEPRGLGQIEIEINGQLSVTEASNDSDEHINAFDLVRVTSVHDDLLYIEKVKK